MKSSKFKKKYKALILDVDGTLVNGKYAVPSKKVTNAINKARDSIYVGVATSRPFFILDHIVSHLKLSGPSIVNGGANIIYSLSGKVLWQKLVSKKDLKNLHKIANSLGVELELTSHKEYPGLDDYLEKDILQVWAPNLDPLLAKEFIDKITQIPTITTYKANSWTKDKVDLVITHAQATKQHGIFEVAKILNISTDDIIGVGDGYNDFPLLMACGLKVAMGNAVPDLKAIADYIAPTVDEDGVADVINKFIL